MNRKQYRESLYILELYNRDPNDPRIEILFNNLLGTIEIAFLRTPNSYHVFSSYYDWKPIKINDNYFHSHFLGYSQKLTYTN